MLDFYYDINTKEDVFVYSRTKQVRKHNDYPYVCFVPKKYYNKYKKFVAGEHVFNDYYTKTEATFYRLELKIFDKDVFQEIQENPETRNIHPKYLKVIFDDNYYIKEEDPTNAFDFKAMAFDIEVGSTKVTFPSAKTGFMLAIGCKIIDDNSDVKIFEIGIDNMKNKNEPSLKKELELIHKFASYLDSSNVDILVGYNSISFDMTFLIERTFVLHELLDNKYANDVFYIIRVLQSYNNGYGYVRKSSFINKNSDIVKTGLHYDIFNTDVMRDTTIRHLRSMSLKSVSRYYGATDVKEFEKSEMKHIHKLYVDRHSDFIEYLTSDIISTEVLYTKYSGVDKSLAGILRIPLSFITSQTNATVPSVYVSKMLYQKNNYIPVGTNISRYNTSDLSASAKYEGALVELHKYGYIDKLYKVDFSRMYPSAMLQFNISPENVRLYEIYDINYTGKNGDRNANDVVWTVEKENSIIYAIRDNNLNKRIAIEISKTEGIICEGIETLSKARDEKKAKMKKALRDNNIKLAAMLESDQMAYKRLSNSIYGIFGNKHTPVGDYLCALTVTGLCRHISGKLRQYLISKYDCFVELDSVTGDTPIYIKLDMGAEKDKSIGVIDIVTIDEVVKNRYTTVLTRHGWGSVMGYKAHSVKKAIYRVEVPQGFVDVTEDHSLFNIDREEITPKFIVAGDNIEIYNRKIKTEINLDYISFNENLYYIDSELIIFFANIVASAKIVNDEIVFEYKKEKDADELGELIKLIEKKFCIHSTYRRGTNMNDTLIYSITITNKMLNQFIIKHFFTEKYKYKKISVSLLNSSNSIKYEFFYTLYNITNFKKLTKLIIAGVMFLANELNIKTSVKNFDVIMMKRLTEEKNIVLNNTILSKDKSITVYDISTSDSTFVSALGNIVLHNTDGFMIDQNVSLDEINDFVKDICINELKSTKTMYIDQKETAIMHLEKEEFGRGFMYKEKNYILEELDSNNNVKDYIIHGSAFISSTKPKCYINAVLEMFNIYSKKTIDEERVNKLYDVYSYERKDLIMVFKISKSKDEYKYTNDLSTKILDNIKSFNTDRQYNKKLIAFESMIDNLMLLIDENNKLYSYKSSIEEDINTDYGENHIEYNNYIITYLDDMKARLEHIRNSYRYNNIGIYDIYQDIVQIYENVINKLNIKQQSMNLALTLINEYEEFYNVKLNKGDYIEYFYTTDNIGYHIAEKVDDGTYNINYDKYREFIADLHKIFHSLRSKETEIKIF